MPHNEPTQNYLDAVHFNHPRWIPVSVSLLPGTWLKHGEAVEEVVLDFPEFFPGYKAGAFKDMTVPRTHQTGRWTDAWGTVWDNAHEGINAIPVDDEAPLRDWDAFDSYDPPDPLAIDDYGHPRDWDRIAQSFTRAKEGGSLATGGLIHGFMFMRLYYLRGFTGLMIDVATREPRLDKLIDMILSRNVALVSKYLDAGANSISGGDDMGMQTSLPVSPADWRHYLKPCFRDIFGPARDAGAATYLHSDGHIVEVIPDLAECGVLVINPQIRANGLARLVELKGTICIKLDLDRQLFPFATPQQIHEHIQECWNALYMPEGGFMLNAECAPDVPPENVRAICEALEEKGCRP